MGERMEMNSVFPDPDLKVNMSLDEIIHLTRGPKNHHPHGEGLRTGKKKGKISKKLGTERSTPLLSSLTSGLEICASKQSPLLNTEQRRRITQAFSNRAVNSDLLEKTKEIIPAEYKLIHTNHGVERVLVPASNCILKPPKKKLLQPRKLNKTSSRLTVDMPNKWLPDGPPPLVNAPIFQPPTSKELKAEVLEPEIVMLDPPNNQKHFEVIDVESDLPVNLVEAKMFIPTPLTVPGSCGRTLNDRFTMLSENFK